MIEKTACLTAVAALLIATTATAEPGFARAYKNQFGYMPSCNACHKDGGGTPVNTYGQQYKDAGSNAGAFAAIADLDADGDGISNGDESASRANPGSANSTPDAPGDWLSATNLIPKPVQSVFKGVTTYKPVDAIFTDSEITRAAQMGVTLTAADENTIYVPVADGRPIGTSIIVPGVHEGRQFFVLLATDRGLNVTHVHALDSGSLEAAEDAALYQPFVGMNIAEIPNAPDDDTLATSAHAAVKKAATMLLVRLKSG